MAQALRQPRRSRPRAAPTATARRSRPPSDEPQSAPSPLPTPTTAPKPEPTATPVIEKPQPEPTPATIQAPQERLAKTGATTDGVVLAVGLIAFGIGVGLVILRLLEGRKHKEETAR